MSAFLRDEPISAKQAGRFCGGLEELGVTKAGFQYLIENQRLIIQLLMIPCDFCKGEGEALYEKGARRERCHVCDGSGLRYLCPTSYSGFYDDEGWVSVKGSSCKRCGNEAQQHPYLNGRYWRCPACRNSGDSLSPLFSKYFLILDKVSG